MASRGKGSDARTLSKPGRWCAAHARTHPLASFEGDRASCRRAEKALARLVQEARAAGVTAFPEPRPRKSEGPPGEAPWAGIDGVVLMMHISEATRRQWYALFDRDPEWCRRAFAEFEAAAYATED